MKIIISPILLIIVAIICIVFYYPRQISFEICPDPSAIISLEYYPIYKNFFVEFSDFVDKTDGMHFTESEMSTPGADPWSCFYSGGEEGPFAILIDENKNHAVYTYGDNWACHNDHCVCRGHDISDCKVQMHVS